jgi:acyl carrier protein
MTIPDLCKLLYEICEDEAVLAPDCELLESGLLDSYAMIELFTRLEDEGIELHPTRIDRTRLQTPRTIAELIREYSTDESK